jgi:hypothetical protein
VDRNPAGLPWTHNRVWVARSPEGSLRGATVGGNSPGQGKMGEELTGILTEGGAGQQSAIVELAMKGKNKAESSSSGVTYKCGVVKLERGMSVVKNGGAPGRFL